MRYRVSTVSTCAYCLRDWFDHVAKTYRPQNSEDERNLFLNAPGQPRENLPRSATVFPNAMIDRPSHTHAPASLSRPYVVVGKKKETFDPTVRIRARVTDDSTNVHLSDRPSPVHMQARPSQLPHGPLGWSQNYFCSDFLRKPVQFPELGNICYPPYNSVRASIPLRIHYMILGKPAECDILVSCNLKRRQKSIETRRILTEAKKLINFKNLFYKTSKNSQLVNV